MKSPADTSSLAVYPAAHAWRVALVACMVAAAMWAGFAPLSDPDLPMHLSIGEWIAKSRAVPFVEPFAWTRPGAPYFAYSWLAQLGFYECLRLFGPSGLHLLAAFGAASAVAAGSIAGRAFGLRSDGATLLGALNAFIAIESTPFLRPQLFMHVLLPLAWACTSALVVAKGRRRTATLAALIAVSALAANLHITFPVVAASIAIPLVSVRPGARAPLPLAVLAVGLGWMLSPYATAWADVFKLNFGPNAITSGMSPAGELAPGFAVAPLIGLALASLPLLALSNALDVRKRVVFGLLWLAGLMVFARYFKGLSPWWWCAFPLASAALARLPVPSTRWTTMTFAALAPAVLLAFSITNVRLFGALHGLEGGVDTRSLPSIKAHAAEAAARWIGDHVRPDARGRLLTSFNYGSYLKWRLPNLSESIDSRGIFPDSAALPDVPSTKHRADPGPWRSSDLAVVSVAHPAASLLDADPAWQLVGVGPPSPWLPESPRVGLWIRRDWFERNARQGASLPLAPTELR